MSNPLVCNKPRIRFYAGFPLQDSDGQTVGTFCVMGLKPRKPDPDFAASEQLIALADAALYRSKRERRDRVTAGRGKG